MAKLKGKDSIDNDINKKIIAPLWDANKLGSGKKKGDRALTVYDPTCGSGSLLLKVADQARSKVTLNGQEKDSATAGGFRCGIMLNRG